MDSIPVVFLKGSHEEIGYQYGKLLKEKINKTIEFYAKYFNCTEQDLSDKATFFKNKIKEFNIDYVKEIDAISEGSNVKPLWIYALNARSEILAFDENECTSLFYKKTSILGQNWDWGKQLENLIVLLNITYDNGHKILMMTEPGIIGKIGLNNSGLGVCLNILRRNKQLNGVPVHIVLRSILDSTSLSEAKNNIKTSGFGKASNILLGCEDSSCLDIEFAGNENFELISDNDFLLHTNHYLVRKINPDIESYKCSLTRYNTASEIINNQQLQSIENIKNLLLDSSNKNYPIHRKYVKGNILDDSGTVCTIIMDLKKKIIHLKKGNSPDSNFKAYRL